ncbi:uncharacterized protein SPSK_07223 [Sporothrix schenckii 1099-18]|uniref:F-box domain-containing protein n=1 Tax=Sporothrix schenckii 1099-18 TaxID=1397361 RepID=A0A0F2MFB2_SPOSC|nr:uncharacterized protein SPSK_07223 [Sporothrix schenckii 1099-18]KJR87764.1 hypothetical protein SPSK_07223 [Sporothrix schenckii 1099-18]
MASTAHSVGGLPYLILDRICDLLDDESADRRDLWSFSLTCRRFCEAADRRRFCQIVVCVQFVDGVDATVAQLRALLGRDNGRRYGYVRRLRVQGLAAGANRDPDLQSDLDEQSADQTPYEAFTYGTFDVMHPFCRLRDHAPGYLDHGDRPGLWQALAGLMRELPALRDVIWTSWHMPRAVLEAAQMPRAHMCRLHMSGCAFQLRSLIYERDRPRSISADDYALMTSPALYSVSARVEPLNEDGLLDYNDYALQQMMAGLAPNLTNVSLSRGISEETSAGNDADDLGRPEFGGFFLGDDNADLKNHYAEKTTTMKGAPLRNLSLATGLPAHIFQCWDTTNVRRMYVEWDHDVGAALAEYAARGELRSLEVLWLTTMFFVQEPARSQAHMLQIFSNAGPLQRLHMKGVFTDIVFNAIARHHGATLRALSIATFGEYLWDHDAGEDVPRTFFNWSPNAILELPKLFPLLEAVSVAMDRTRGDCDEVALYRALSRMPSLQYLLIRLACSIDLGVDAARRSEIFSGDNKRLMAYANKATFANAAVDATLARAVFDVVSSNGQGPLQMLHIQPRSSLESNDATFESVMDSLNRSWALHRQADGTVVIKPLDVLRLRSAVEMCTKMTEANETCSTGDKVFFPHVFQELWPGNGPWWENYTSLPLDLS